MCCFINTYMFFEDKFYILHSTFYIHLQGQQGQWGYKTLYKESSSLLLLHVQG